MIKTISVVSLAGVAAVIAFGPKKITANHEAIEIERSLALHAVGFLFVPGDTLNYTARWPKWKGATRYQYSVRSSASGWTLPTSVITVDSFAPLRLVNIQDWDTTTFRLVVKGGNSLGFSKDSAYVSWKVSRPLVPPGPPVIDSSTVVVALVLRPENIALITSDSACRAVPEDQRTDVQGVVNPKCIGINTGGVRTPMVVQTCLFFLMLDAKYYTYNLQPSNEVECKRQYDLLPVQGRLPGYPPARISIHSRFKEFKIVIGPSGTSVGVVLN